MNRFTRTIFSRGMAILLFVLFAAMLVTYSVPAQARVKQTNDVSVSGDLDDVSGDRISTGGGASGTGGSGGSSGSAANQEIGSTSDRDRISIFDSFVTQFIGIWMFMMRR